MNIVLSLLLLLIGGISIICAINKKRPMLLILAAFFTVYLALRPVLLSLGLYNIYAYLNPSVIDYDESALTHCIIFTLISYVLLLFTYHKTKKRIKIDKSSNNDDQRESNSNYNFVAFIIALLLIFSVILIPMYVCFVYLLLLILYYIIKYKGDGRKLNVVLSALYYILLILLLFFISDDRRDWLVAIGVPLYIYIFVYLKSLIKILIPSIVCLLLLVYISVAFRSGGDIFDYDAVKNRAESVSATLTVLEVETDFSIVFDDYLLLFDKRYSSIDFLYGVTILKPVISIIPRSIFPDKPETSSRLFPKYFNKQFYNVGGSEPVTLFGELYWNFSYLSLIVFMLLGNIIALIDNTYLHNRSNYLFSALVLSLSLTGFHLLRGPIDSFCYLYLWLILAYQLLNVVKKIK
ncbi:hypothetical protein [Escherichia coli]|uniref:hypothetical protein n=1 Tax=Escherichia coli TaxID=562 RepID=UPI001058A1D4|nr:hypothetical protein [Escherichia coli]EIH4362643.1 hypothetical protein [Escherichia coli]EIH4392742.1 hypothetical protein [Escherichia coli]MBF0069420.1 hypothetical protein [Escherichia coli]MBS9278713.1 hypothetical protein [Escherichia coli]MCT6285847.1 hypothetical protein [Escherichia coli]